MKTISLIYRYLLLLLVCTPSCNGDALTLIMLNRELSDLEKQAAAALPQATIEYTNTATFPTMQSIINRIAERTKEFQKKTFEPSLSANSEFKNAMQSEDTLFGAYKKFFTITNHPIKEQIVTLKKLQDETFIKSFSTQDASALENFAKAINELWKAITAWKLTKFEVDKPVYYFSGPPSSLADLAKELENALTKFKKDSEKAGIEFTKDTAFPTKDHLIKHYSRRISKTTIDQKTNTSTTITLDKVDDPFTTEPGGAESSEDSILLTKIAELIESLWNFLNTFNQKVHIVYYLPPYPWDAKRRTIDDILKRINDSIDTLEKNPYHKYPTLSSDNLLKVKTAADLLKTVADYEIISLKKGNTAEREKTPIKETYLQENTEEFKSLSLPSQKDIKQLKPALDKLWQIIQQRNTRFYIEYKDPSYIYTTTDKTKALETLKTQQPTTWDKQVKDRATLIKDYLGKLQAVSLDHNQYKPVPITVADTQEGSDLLQALSPEDQRYIQDYKKALEAYEDRVFAAY